LYKERVGLLSAARGRQNACEEGLDNNDVSKSLDNGVEFILNTNSIELLIELKNSKSKTH